MGRDSELTLSDFIEEWQEKGEGIKTAFLGLKSHIENKDGVAIEFLPRPGVTYSLRAVHSAQKEKGLFAMVDVIEDEPRWLSVCFYGEMITDPDEKGDFVPAGLLGENAVCFDIETREDQLIQYVQARLDEAWLSASRGT